MSLDKLDYAPQAPMKPKNHHENKYNSLTILITSHFKSKQQVYDK